MSNSSLVGKNILVTGASSGIGFATAKLLSDLGANPILTSRNKEELENAARILHKSSFTCDLTNDSEVRQLILDVTAQFELYGLVNNAGGGGWASVQDSDDEWRKSFELDILGSVRTARYLYPSFKKQAFGAIVNVSSLWGISQTAKPSIASYCVAKAGLIKLTESMAQELAPHIRVNAVAPGWTKTRMLSEMTSEDLLFLQQNVLLKRLAEPEEIAKVIVFLLSSDSSYLTGQCIHADGGYLLNRTHPAN